MEVSFRLILQSMMFHFRQNVYNFKVGCLFIRGKSQFHLSLTYKEGPFKGINAFILAKLLLKNKILFSNVLQDANGNEDRAIYKP